MHHLVYSTEMRSAIPSHRLSGCPMPLRSTISTGRSSIQVPLAWATTILRLLMVIHASCRALREARGVWVSSEKRLSRVEKRRATVGSASPLIFQIASAGVGTFPSTQDDPASHTGVAEVS